MSDIVCNDVENQSKEYPKAFRDMFETDLSSKARERAAWLGFGDTINSRNPKETARAYP